MKMNRFTAKISGLVLALSFLFVISACSDIDSGEAPGNGTYLVLAPNGVSFDARSVEPDANYMMANFTDITLTATKSGGTKQTLASSIGNLESLYAKQFLLEGGAGTYSFELKGSLDSVYFYQKLEEETIEESKTNAISFSLSPIKSSSDTSDFEDKGGLSVDLKFSKTNVKSIYVTLLNLDTNEIKEERTISSSYFTSSGYTYKKNASYPNYYTELYTEGSIDPGTYRLTFDFLTDNKLLINSFSYIVHVVKGLNSIVTQEIDLNQVYSISYTKNGGSLAEGVEIAKYTRLNEVILPRLARDNYTFIGWYNNSSFEGEPVTKIEKGSTGNKSFYARFVSSALYVNAANGDDSHDGSSGSSTNALQTLGAALNKMALTADGKKLDYTIYLTGTFTGEQKIEDPSGSALPASSITLAGYSVVDSDGVPKDVLDGGFTESSKGSTLTISTTVPVIIKNLKITGGYAEEGKGGGITLSQGTSLTLESGEISGNSGVSSSAAVYVSASSTKGAVFTMNGGTICNNTGNGVCVHDGSKPASFNMTGGSITGNTGYGVWLPASGGYYAQFSMSGSALVTEDNIVEVPNRIIVAGLLTGDSPVVTIKPSSYSESKIVYLADGLTDTSILASASEKIAVVPQGEALWAIDSNGYLKELVTCAKIDATNCYSLAELVSKIEAADSATTVIFYNTLTASDIGKAGTSGTILHAIKNNSNSDATFEISVDSTNGKIALDADSSSMFENCSKITSLDMNGFDTSAVTDMSYMFSGCSELTYLDLTGWTTTSVTDMRYMFSGCSALSELDLSNFDTKNVTNMQAMFENCTNLETLTLSSNFDTSKVTSMYWMFYSCSKLSAVDLSSFVTTAVTDDIYGFNSMFMGCSSLTELDVSTFEIIEDANISSMFENCSSLATIYAASDANWYAEDRSSSYMFRGCTSLTGYSEYNVDSQYAHVGTVDGKSGYFTAKN